MAFFTRRQTAEPVVSEKHVYLIDTENVKSVWTLLLERMTEEDKVYVFYTMNSGSVSYEAITGILQSGKKIELVECFTGKNGLDFQLVSYLGYMIHENEKADYCIVSDDGGYDAAVRFWEKKGIKVSRRTASEVSGKPSRPTKGHRLKSLGGVKVTATTKKKEKPAESPAAAKAKTAKPAETPAVPKEKTAKPAENAAAPRAKEAKPAENAAAPRAKEAKPAETPAAPKAKTVKPAESSGPRTVSRAETVQPAEATKPVETKPVEKKPAEKVLPIVEVAEPQDVSELPMPQEHRPRPRREAPAKTARKKPQSPSGTENGGAAANVKPTEEQTYRVSEDALKNLLPQESDERIAQIRNVLDRAGRPDNLADIHDGIEKIYRDENSQTIYRTLRPHVKDIYKQV